MSTQLLQQGDSDEEFRHETYDTINRQVARITKIVRGIKSFAQQQDHTVGPISIPEVIEQALELIAHAFRTRGLAVALNLGEHLPPVQGDRDQILQVFVNLLTNARDVMPNGGSLDISAAVTVVDSQRSIQTKICDTGPGIPHEIKSRIFDPFFTTKEIDQGTGLGLSICHGFIAEHGGTIYAESVVDQGTTMIVNLPIKDGPTP